MNLKISLKVFIIVIFILFFMISINAITLNMHDVSKSNIFLQLYEGFDTPLIMDKSNAFCETHLGSSGSLDESCNKLTRDNCNETSCCVWTSNNKCVAGGQDGPTFNSNSNDLDYYFFQDKCYGPGCKNTIR